MRGVLQALPGDAAQGSLGMLTAAAAVAGRRAVDAEIGLADAVADVQQAVFGEGTVDPVQMIYRLKRELAEARRALRLPSGPGRARRRRPRAAPAVQALGVDVTRRRPCKPDGARPVSRADGGRRVSRADGARRVQPADVASAEVASTAPVSRSTTTTAASASR